jgi:hypothetical protein
LRGFAFSGLPGTGLFNQESLELCRKNTEALKATKLLKKLMINAHHLSGFDKWILYKTLTPEESHVYRKGSHQACTTPEGSNSFTIA